MDTITKNVEWKTSEGKNIVAVIERTVKVENVTSWSDGFEIEMGEKTVDTIKIEVYADGKFVTRCYDKPNKISKQFYGNYDQLISKGIYARVGDVYINQARYEMILDAIAEMDTAITSTDEHYAEVKEKEIAKEAAEDAKIEKAIEYHKIELANGLCPICGTYCYGDCQANN